MDQWLGYFDLPYYFALDKTGLNPPDIAVWVYRLVAVIILGLIALSILDFINKLLGRLSRGGKDDDADSLDLTADEDFRKAIESPTRLKHITSTLKKQRNYERLGEVYSLAKQPKDAAKWFKKAKNYRRAAGEFVLLDNKRMAAEMLLKEKDYPTAGRLFAEAGRFKSARKAYEKHGFLPGVADCWMKDGKLKEAAQTYREYFANPSGGAEVQVNAAQSCYSLLDDPAAREKVDAETQRGLAQAVARIFEQTKHFPEAAALYRRAGDSGHAGELYLAAGKLEQAAQCMKEAGREKEAAEIGGRYYASIKHWKEAALAFAGAGDWARAGECFARDNQFLPAAQHFEKAGEHYQAGLNYAKAAKYEDAIRTLQKLEENNKYFDVSRALLGRCFYELHDFAHCAATLDNHLMGKRVDHKNIDYFYMLALAYEQLGKLEQSQEIFYKIRSVDVGYRDVKDRVSSIESRISMMTKGSGPTPASMQAQDATSADEVAQMVERSLKGRYRIEKELGRGGMGVVYLARDKQLDRPVALKFLGSLVDGSEEYRKRFEREARAAAKVNHPNIISIYDISSEQGKAYIAMEYVEGPNLHRYIAQKGALPPREAVNLIRQACSALQAVHEAGVVHRDIKPDNILVAKGGLAKLTDFGLAKGDGTRLTAANAVLGTPSYMAPEQVMGKEADARSDIYSLGLVLYEALTGKTAFLGKNVLERQKSEMPPTPGTIADAIPGPLDALVMKCIAKDPVQRYQSAGDLLNALKEVAG